MADNFISHPPLRCGRCEFGDLMYYIWQMFYSDFRVLMWALSGTSDVQDAQLSGRYAIRAHSRCRCNAARNRNPKDRSDLFPGLQSEYGCTMDAHCGEQEDVFFHVIRVRLS